MELIGYTFDEALARTFAGLCDSLYKHENYWRISSRQRLLSQFASDHDFYQCPGNAHCHFLAVNNGKPMGHISAIVNADLQARYGQLGIIGFFECIDDSAVATKLINAARRWFHNHNGINRLIGPMNFDIWRGYRFMTKGLDKPHFFGEPHNKEFYPRFFEQNGFIVCKRWISILVEGQAHLKALMEPWLPCYQNALSDGYHFRPFDPKSEMQMEQLKLAIEDSYRRFIFFNTLSLSEFNKVFGAYIESLDHHFVTLIENKEGSVAGFAIAFPGDGPNAPAIMFMLGITQKESTRSRGVGRAALYHCLQQLIETGYTKVLFALAAEDSPGLRLLGKYAKNADREYVLYQSQL